MSRPDAVVLSAITVAVTTADEARAPLEAAGAGSLTVVDHDEY